MHAFIRGKEVGFSPGRFYGGVADLLAGVEEEEGYIVDGKWVGWEGKEERKKRTMEVLTRTEEAASDEAGSADIIRRTASDKERSRMEEMLQSPPSLPPSRSSPSSPYPEERVQVHLEVQTRRRAPAATESECQRDRDVALQGGSQKAVDSDQECILSDTVPESVQVRRPANLQKREDADLSTVPPLTQSQARSREMSSSPSLPHL
jgi:triacylglycerol lipase